MGNVCVTELKGATSEEINSSIVLPNSLPLTWKQDDGDGWPWIITDDPLYSKYDNETQIKNLTNTNHEYVNSSSKISFSYSAKYPSTLTFKHRERHDFDSYYRRYYQLLNVAFDNNLICSTSERNITSETIQIPKGEHTITFEAQSLDNGYSTNLYATIWDVCITGPESPDLTALNAKIVKETCTPIEWEHDDNFPVEVTEDGVRTSNAMWQNTNSGIKGKIKIDKPTQIYFDWRLGYNDSQSYDNKHYAYFYVDGSLRHSTCSETEWTTKSITLSPGEHTLEWKYNVTTSGAKYWMELRNLTLSTSDWLSIESSPGLLGVETLYKVEKLQDIKLLKIKGAMNDYDWATIKKMTNLYGLDLSQAEILTIPAGFNANEQFGYLVLPETLETIPDNAFQTCKLTSLRIPASVKRIGNMAFSNTVLENLTVADNSKLATIGYKAFYGTPLRKFTMPVSVTTLDVNKGGTNPDYAGTFAYCTKLETLVLSDSLKHLPAYTCAGCTNLTKLHLPVKLQTMGTQFMTMGTAYEFTRGTTKLETLDIPGTLSIIPADAFRNVTSLKSVKFGNGITHINDYAFNNTDLATLDLPESLTYIGVGAFGGALSLKETKFPSKLATIDKWGFSGSALAKVTFSESINSIGQEAFKGCQLESAVLPVKLTTLGSQAFANNTKLSHIQLPQGVTGYSDQFIGCNAITSIESLATAPPSITGDPLKDCDKTKVTLRVPKFAVPQYKLDDYWYQFGSIVEGAPSDYWKINGDIRLLNNRRMDGKPDIDLYYGGKFTVKGDAAMPMGRFDMFTSDANPSAFLTDCPSVTADQINVVYKVDANKWYFFTPMCDIDLTTVQIIGTPHYVFRYYDGAVRAEQGAGNSWKNISELKLKAGVGYIFQCAAPAEILFPIPAEHHGKIIGNETFTIPLQANPSDNKAHRGWNYVGNPYPSFFDIYFMDFVAPITVWNGSTYKAYSVTDDEFVLRPMQGFFVQKPDAVDNIVLQANGRQVESIVSKIHSAPQLSPAVGSKPRSVFNLRITTGDNCDDTRIVLNDAASTDYELERDAAKFMSTTPDVPQIYSIDYTGTGLAINERPADNGEIKLGVYLPADNQTSTIAALRIDGEAWLYDAETKVKHDLSQSSYNFTGNKGIDENRFTLILKSGGTSDIRDLNAGRNIKFESHRGILNIAGTNGAKIDIYNSEAILVHSIGNCAETVRIPLTPGIYAVTINGVTYKVAVN